jgi:hypothetical protein
MSTNTAPAPDAPFTIRRETVSPEHGYELSLREREPGAWLHVFEGRHDAALPIVPAQIVELRADLATMLLKLGYGLPQVGASGVRSPAGVAIVEHLRQAFLALVELDKHAPSEVDQIAALIVGHIRSWRPFVLQEVVGG